MKTMLKSFYTKPLVIYLAVALLAISTLSGPAEAMFLPAASGAGMEGAALTPFDRAADLSKIQTALESKALRQRLLDYGLSPEETMAKLSTLSDEQIHKLAANMDSFQAGGDVLVGILIIALLVVLLIYLLEGRIEVRRR